MTRAIKQCCKIAEQLYDYKWDLKMNVQGLQIDKQNCLARIIQQVGCYLVG